jgi:hypothetical protein
MNTYFAFDFAIRFLIGTLCFLDNILIARASSSKNLSNSEGQTPSSAGSETCSGFLWGGFPGEIHSR